ncbi:hypothetical protein COCNU_12G006760 [Cocos nucifera]|uniref:Uncharacterized protein n=1 Tax=Cocos nucifera TaxID=13894 RepID=A0A8K0NAV2_COCNU|nr:hypothetical protein COCNU_12G006760 [Cocos nucifera]
MMPLASRSYSGFRQTAASSVCGGNPAGGYVDQIPDSKKNLFCLDIKLLPVLRFKDDLGISVSLASL